MPQFELSSSQRTMLSSLVNTAQSEGAPVPAKAIASAIDREPGTVRNQMSTLIDLGLVEGIPGPNGGYRPTETAAEALGRESVDDPTMAIMTREFDRVSALVDDIAFTNVHHPTTCRARIQFQESIRGLEEGDAIAIGATPNAELLLAGVIEAIEPGRNRILLDISQLEASSL
ncbi:TrmB family transcriptional regulator [Natrarchaeobius halalkaliphilus]|uniref:TrmB family transcriptional regulator n=1 Tax=Natrarchaeobius halalkaliphilus TaxID=1679091 RepID=A0A3N6LIY7_9EURY|nr:Rrf2 family transcriptional regulator [Natrarchaeobius halalkaliphilus]RQG87976.1 TrmB family transcriptional regulator [Natrarchaeobius halalkaliphilus]